MIIKKFSVRNFGPIVALDFEPSGSANVFGLTGRNGAGKSHVFRAMSYALTGGLADDNDASAAATFIRYGETSASVSLTFVQGVHTVTISRSFTKSSAKRSLTVEGPEACTNVTSSEEVTRRLTAIIGADLADVARCVFVPQGMFMKLLFGAWSERERLMADVLGAVDFSDARKTALARAERLRIESRDIRPLMDAAQGQLNALLAELRTSEHAFPDLSITEHDTKLARCAQYAEKCRSLTTADASLKEARAKQAAYVGDFVTADQVTTLTNNWQQAQADLATANRELQIAQANVQSTKQILDDANSEARKSEAHRGAVSDYMGALRSIETKIKAADPLWCEGITEALADPNRLRQFAASTAISSTGYTPHMLAARRVKEALQQGCNTIVVVLEEAKSVSDALALLRNQITNEQRGIEEINARKVAFHGQYDAEHASNSVTLKLIAALTRSHFKPGDTNCPVCQSAIPDMAEIVKTAPQLQARETWYESNVMTMERDLNTTKAALRTMELRAANLESRSAELQKTSSTYALSLDQAKSRLTEHSAEILKIDSIAAGLMLNGVQDCYRTCNSVNFSDPLFAVHAVSTADDIAKLHAPAVSAATDAAQAALTVYQEATTKATKAGTASDQHAQALRVAQASYRLTSELAATIAHLDTSVRAIAAELEQPEMLAGAIPEDARQAIQLDRDKRVSEAAVRQRIRQQMMQTDAEITKLKEEEAAGAKKKLACAFLDVTASLFEKRGFQAEFLKRRFAVIVSAVNEALTAMQSGFQVMMSENEELAFDVKFTGDAAAEWKPMGKLSGGQRVRLSIAFLIAIQATVLRNVGLMILDEPSNHVDNEGVEAMVDMIQSMQPVWKSHGTTVLICDHKPEMRRAFQANIELATNPAAFNLP